MNKLLILVLVFASCATQTQESTDNLNLASKLQEVSEINILRDKNYHNWGSSIVKAEDGKYHMFYAQMSKELGFSTWLTDGIVSHAVSDHPAGPYVFKEVVLKGRGKGYWDAHTAHNPRIKYFEGKYYLYYMSTNVGDKELTVEEFAQARKSGISNKYRALVRENQRIGVAVSNSINGPWERFDVPIVLPSGPIAQITCNPALTERPEGGYIMILRGDKPNVKYANGSSPTQSELIRSQAIALSERPVGPWEIQPKAAVGNLNSEDPAIWYDQKRKRYYGIYHAFGYMGMITSTDGINWEKAKHYKVLDKAIKKSDGTEVSVHRLERPYVYVENGEALVLTVAALDMDGNAYSLCIPLK